MALDGLWQSGHVSRHGDQDWPLVRVGQDQRPWGVAVRRVGCPRHLDRRKKPTRRQFRRFRAEHPACVVVFDACGRALRWAAEMETLGHEARTRRPYRRCSAVHGMPRLRLRAGHVEPQFQSLDRRGKLDPFAEKLTGWLVAQQHKSRKERRMVQQPFVPFLAERHCRAVDGVQRASARVPCL